MDHAATTPVREEVLEGMMPYFSQRFGNSSSLYGLAHEARVAVDVSREKVASVLNSRTSEIVFTSGGTESNNLAIKGLESVFKDRRTHVITSAIEHHGVLHPIEQLSNDGVEVTIVDCDQYGILDPDDFVRSVKQETILASIMLANNEVGTIQKIADISRKIKERSATLGGEIYIHTDAVQAAGKLSLDTKTLDVDLLSLSGHKIYAPKGVGVLYVRRGTPIEPLIAGGGQERQRRSGTENVPSIVGMGIAIDLAENERAEFYKRTSKLRDKMEASIIELIPDTKMNGHSYNRLPNISNMSFPGVEAESLLIGLDFRSIAASSGSACSTASVDPSHVLTAMGLNRELAVGALRLSLGKDTGYEDVAILLKELPAVLEKLRDMPNMAS